MRRWFVYLLILGLLGLGAAAVQSRAAVANSAPSLVAISASQNPLPRSGVVVFTTTFQDPQGAADIRSYYFGLAPCTSSITVSYNSNFERNLARFIGLYATRSGSYGSARNHFNLYSCAGGEYGSNPWVAGGTSNATGSMQLLTRAEAVEGNQLIVTWTVQLTNFPAGNYYAYYMVEDMSRVWQTGSISRAWYRGPAMPVSSATPTPTATGTTAPTSTPTAAPTATPLPTRTPTATPIPNQPPSLAQLILQQAVVTRSSLVQIHTIFADPEGAESIERAYLGITDCTVDPGQAYQSNFERHLSNYFGAYTLLQSSYQAVARSAYSTLCTGGALGLNPWSTLASNATGTAQMLSLGKNFRGNQVELIWRIQLHNFPPGSYAIYTMAADQGGLWTTNSTTAAWQRHAQTLTVLPPPNPVIEAILLSGADVPEITIGQGSSFRLLVKAFNDSPASGEAPRLYLSFPGQDPAVLDSIQPGPGSSPTLIQHTSPSDPLHPAIWFEKSQWAGFEREQLELTITPMQPGTFEILIKFELWQAAERYLAPLTSPFTDQAGDPAYRRIVQVEPTADLIGQVNRYRDLAGLPRLTGRADWNQGCFEHARYMARNDQVTHAQDPANPWYTFAGAAAAQTSALVGFQDAFFSPGSVVDALMASPFHALQLLNPQLVQSGYGVYTDTLGSVQLAGCLDVARGVDYLVSPAYPVYWPAPGGQQPLLAFSGTETPDPLVMCGYSAPTGPAILLQLGGGNLTPQVSASSFLGDEGPLPHCVFAEGSYTHPDPVQQNLGRSILAELDGVVLLPRDPLVPGRSYQVSLNVSGQHYLWNFEIAPGFVQPPPGQILPWEAR